MGKKTRSNIHFVGIGGIGMSALARYYAYAGERVSGSDLSSSEITAELSLLGIKISSGRHKKANIPPGTRLVIHTAAAKSNPELSEAKKRRIRIKSYAEAVGDLTKKYKTIAVSGSHGKSTTAALSALVLEEGCLDPTVIVGTKVKEFGNSNFRPGLSSYLVLEADEWNKSFLYYHPKIAIVTNIDFEHADTYATPEILENAFEEFLAKVSADGLIIANRDNERLARVAVKFGKKVVWYSLQDRESGVLKKILKIPGEYNISNALAALKLGRLLGIHEPVILKALSRFQGAWRRFEFKGMINGAFVFDDYGHHPTEIQSTIKAARERFSFRRVWCVFQPHQYERLMRHWPEFISAFDLADQVCLLPVYKVAGRENETLSGKFNSKKLARELVERGKRVFYSGSFGALKKFIRAHAKKGDIILMMGAGDIYTLTPEIVETRGRA